MIKDLIIKYTDCGVEMVGVHARDRTVDGIKLFEIICPDVDMDIKDAKKLVKWLNEWMED